MINFKLFIENPYLTFFYLFSLSLIPKIANFLFKKFAPEKQIGFAFIKKDNLYYAIISSMGSSSIEAKDFDVPLKIKFDKKINSIYCDLYKVYPENLSPKILVSNSGVEIRPLLMNSGDKMVIKINSGGEVIENPILSFRISNVKDFVSFDEGGIIYRVSKSNYFEVLFSSLVLLSFINGLFSENLGLNNSLIFTIIPLFLIVLIIFAVAFSKYKINLICDRNLFYTRSSAYAFKKAKPIFYRILFLVIGFFALLICFHEGLNIYSNFQNINNWRSIEIIKLTISILFFVFMFFVGLSAFYEAAGFKKNEKN